MNSPCHQRERSDLPALAGQGARADISLHDWPLNTYLVLGALSSAVPCARLHVKHVLWEWRLHTVADTAELLVSELITNSVKASRAMPQRPPVWVRVSASAGQLLIEAWDGSPEPPEPRQLEDGFPGFGDESGRGLFLVASLSEQWGWYPTYDVMGKVVWCLLHVEPAGGEAQNAAAASPPLPKRIRQAIPAPPAQAMHDPHVLLRLRDGLLGLEVGCQ